MSWHEYSLGEVCNIARGGSPRPIDKFITTDDDGINWVKISDATRSKKYIFQTNEKIIKEGINRSRLVKDGDFLLSNSMSFGRPYIMRTTGCIHDGWLVLSDYEKLIDINFFYYLLSSPVVFNQFEKLAQGSTVRNLNKELVSRVKVKLPSLATQQKIVEKLDAIFAEIDRATVATETNVKNAEALFQSYLTEVFERGDDGWKSDELGQITKFIDYRGKTPTKTDSGIRLITAKNVKFGFINKEPYEYIAESDYETWMTRGIPVKGDVLFTTEAPLANVAQLDTDEKVVFAQRLIILQSKHGILDNEFLKFSLLSKKIQEEIISKGTGATVKGIKASLLKKIYIKYPSVETQKEICKSVSTIQIERDKLKEFYSKRLEDLIVYKQSILKQAFNGELVKE